MRFLDYFRSTPRNSAVVAKERLQIIVAHERGHADTPDYLPLLQKDLLQAVRKYVSIDEDQITVSVDRSGDCEVLELNIALPDGAQVSAPPVKHEPISRATPPRKASARSARRKKPRRR